MRLATSLQLMKKNNVLIATVLGDRHLVFAQRVARQQMKFAFRYGFWAIATSFFDKRVDFWKTPLLPGGIE